jgi:hypothetical protein
MLTYVFMEGLGYTEDPPFHKEEGSGILLFSYG